MCGIAGFYFFTPNDKIDQDKLLNALVWGIDSRGGDACGISAFNSDGLILHEKAACDAKEFIKGREPLPSSALFALVHTRFATQGHQGFMRNNHPVVSEGVHVTHNGHIMNDSAVFGKIKVPRLAEVDTEAIPAYVASVGWENWRTALEDLQGGMAVAMAHEDYPGELILAKGSSSPLVYFFNGKILVWASTKECLMGAWKATIGKPPMPDKIKSLTMGDAIIVKDGKLSLERFKAQLSKYTGYTYYDYDSLLDDGWEKTASGSWKKKYVSNSDQFFRGTAAESAKVLMPGKNNPDASASMLAEQEVELEVMRAEVDRWRRRTDEIMNSAENWWRDEDLLKEFNALWDKIREVKDDIADVQAAAAEGATFIRYEEPEEDEDGWTTVKDESIQCPSCLMMVPLSEMDTRPGIGDELYCEDCLDQWDYINKAL